MKKVALLLILGSVILSQSIEAAPNLKNGKEIEDNKCYKCHADKSGFGDGTLIYTRKDRRIATRHHHFEAFKTLHTAILAGID